MKISPPIDAVATELEAWALEDGWKAVGIAIAERYHAGGGGDILPAVDTCDGLRNAIQRVKRIFRGIDGPRYASVALELKPAALASLPAERRARLLRPHDPVRLATIAAKESIEAVNAIHLGTSLETTIREVDEAIAAFAAIKNALFVYGNINGGCV